MLAAAAICALLFSSCSYEEYEREIGYKGKARVNPWLAAERFAKASGFEVVSSPTWQEPTWEDSVWFVPGMHLGNKTFIRQLETWMDDGGHLVVLLDNAESEANDWGRRFMPTVPEPALLAFLERSGIVLSEGADAATTAEFEGRSFRVEATSMKRVRARASEAGAGVVATTRHGLGRLTVVADARVFRNRWIDKEEHAALLDALLGESDDAWRAGFIRGSGLTFWGLLGSTLWPVLIAFAAWLMFWLWRCFGRFGPLEAVDEPNNLRGYDTHLEALGGFHWELNRAADLLAPLRARIIERAHHVAARGGRADADVLDVLAERAGMPRDEVARAMAATAPKDAATLTRTTANLQHLLHKIQ
jgi:hypothetical protein